MAAAISSTQINLTWTDNTNGSASFIIVRATGSGGFAQVATVQAGLTSYSDTSLSPGTKYTYAVEASSVGGQSDFSNSASATTPGTPPPPQPGPNNDPGTFDVKLGVGGAKTVKFTDVDGTVGTIVWSGPGSALARFTGDGLRQISGRGAITVTGPAGLWEIDATGTTVGTSITITTRGGNNSVDVEGIVSDGAIGKIVARTSNITGDIAVNGALRQIAAASISGGLLSASSVSALSVSGVFADSISLSLMGTFSASSVNGGAWNVSGGTKSVLAGSISGLSATFGGSLISMKVRNSDVNSTITGTAIGTLDLGGLDSSARVSPCAVTAHTINTFAGKAHGKRFSLHKLSAASDLSSMLEAKGLTASDVLIQME